MLFLFCFSFFLILRKTSDNRQPFNCTKTYQNVLITNNGYKYTFVLVSIFPNQWSPDLQIHAQLLRKGHVYNLESCIHFFLLYHIVPVKVIVIPLRNDSPGIISRDDFLFRLQTAHGTSLFPRLSDIPDGCRSLNIWYSAP